MKKQIALLLTLMLCLALCACGGRDVGDSKTASAPTAAPQNEEAAAPDSAADAETYPIEEVMAKMEENIPNQEVRDLAAKYLDLTHYENGVLNRSAFLDHVVASVKVDGVTVDFGISYAELLALGIEPQDEGYPDMEGAGIPQSGRFLSADGNVFEIGIYADEGVLLRDGSLSYVGSSIFGDTDAAIDLEGITYGTSFADVLRILGDPSALSLGSMYGKGYDGEQGLALEFDTKDGSTYITIVIDPATETVGGIDVTSTGV